MENSVIRSGRCSGSCVVKRGLSCFRGMRWSITFTCCSVCRPGTSFWSRGYCVSTVGFDEESVWRYIEEQEEHDKRQEQGPLMFD